MIRALLGSFLALAFVVALFIPSIDAAETGGNPMAQTLHDFTMKRIDGKDESLAAWEGKVVLVVNTASRCGFTPQYEGLEALYEKYKDKGFAVLGFPANNFMGQEPGTNEEIATFCRTKYDVSFPMFAKISVKGKDIAPLYAWLTRDSGFGGDIGWNFTKFLVGPDGRVIARYDSKTKPDDAKLVAKLEESLAALKAN